MIQIPIEMPKTCYECRFNVGEYSPEFYEKRHCDITGKGITKRSYKTRPSICPLKEVKDESKSDSK